jgi:Amt family ammonium transporter
VVAAHGVGGTVGALLTGVLAQKVWNTATDGALFGNPKQLGIQFVAVAATIVYSAAVSWGLLKAIGAVVALRPTAPDEGLGLDVSQHGEEAYARGEGAILILAEPPGPRVSAAAPVLRAEGGRS